MLGSVRARKAAASPARAQRRRRHMLDQRILHAAVPPAHASFDVGCFRSLVPFVVSRTRAFLPPGNFRERAFAAIQDPKQADTGALSMRTPWPAARSAHAFAQLGAHAFDMRLSCLGLLDGGYPANPFIARQRGNVLPGRLRLRRSEERLPQVRWNRMQGSGRKSACAHVLMITTGSSARFIFRQSHEARQRTS